MATLIVESVPGIAQIGADGTLVDSTHGSNDPRNVSTILTSRARAMVPALRERAGDTERNGFVSDETVGELRDAGLLRASTPEKYGGYAGVDYDLALEIAYELGRGCASTAWCYSIWQSHNWMVGNTHPRAQEDYFATGPDVLSSTASSPKRTSVAFTDDGFRLSGHWGFASGSKHAQWFFIGPPEVMGAMIVPRADVEILDTWRSPGLRGTGSNDVTAQDAEVPGHRFWSPLDNLGPGGPLGWSQHQRPSYRVPMWFFTYTILAPLTGAGRGAVEAFTERYTGTKAGGPMGPPVTRHAGSEPLQMALAESSAEVDLATLLWRTDMRRVLDQASAGVPFTLEQRALVRRNQVYAAKLIVRAVTRLFETTGAHALTDTDPLQRIFRDVHAGSHHITLPWEATMASAGATALGQPFSMDFQRDGIDPALVAEMAPPPAAPREDMP